MLGEINKPARQPRSIHWGDHHAPHAAARGSCPVCHSASCRYRSAGANRRAERAQSSSAEEGVMEGVLVSAKKAGSTITITVAPTTRAASASRPASSSPASTRSASAPSATTSTIHKSVEVAARKTDHASSSSSADRRTSPTQMSNAEWFISFPGNDQRKRRCSIA